MARIAGLEHPNILPIYDFGQQDDLLYIVTRYEDGGTLKDRLPPPFSPEQARRMITPIAGALDYLHNQGVVDGNLKPSNVLIDQQGAPLVTDLGYAQGIDVGEREAVYLSPEQAQGAFADERTDVYALGVLLYQMLIGEPPAPGVAPSPRLKQPDLPVEVEKVILKAMAQYPEQRFQTPAEFSRALDLALAPQAPPRQPGAQPEPVPPPASPPPSAPPPRRGPSWLVVLLVGLVVLCLLAVCGVAVFGGLGGSPAAPAPTATAPPGQPALPPGQTPDGGLIQGLFDMIESIFQSIASIFESILGGGTTPEAPGEPTPEPPPTEEQPPAEQLPAETPAG
jgi:serine/threonine protein kinase